MFGSGMNVKHGGWSTLRCLTGVGLAMLSAGAASAQQHPDLSGYWELRYDSFNVPQASVTPGTLAGAAAQIRHDIEAVRWCDLVGMPAIMGDRAPIDLRQSASVIGIVAKTQSSERYIYLDGRKHPEKDELDSTTNGHSIGQWEGETLLVDTIGFNDRGVTRLPGGGVRTSNSHLSERYRLMGNGQRLDVTFTWEDADVFTKPHSYEFRYYRIPEISDPRIFPCNAKDAERAKFLIEPPVAK
jgi:hypothetical protein